MALRKRLVAILGIVVGILTLRKVRKRRSKKSESTQSDIDHEDLDSASGHAAAAADHAKIAAEKAVEDRKKKKA